MMNIGNLLSFGGIRGLPEKSEVSIRCALDNSEEHRAQHSDESAIVGGADNVGVVRGNQRSPKYFPAKTSPSQIQIFKAQANDHPLDTIDYQHGNQVKTHHRKHLKCAFYKVTIHWGFTGPNRCKRNTQDKKASQGRIRHLNYIFNTIHLMVTKKYYPQ